VVQRLVEMPVAEAILKGEIAEGARIRLRIVDGKLVARALKSDRRALEA
jgi:predicted transcriptional regulator